ncbi:enoyl-CoA hydratase/isomerase family protein [Thermodesulfobacteriota bacterium]
MSDALLRVEKDGRITTLTLNNPDRRNALSWELVDELAAAVESIEADPDVLAVILTGSGKGFASGADVTTMAGPQGMSEEEVAAYIKSFYLKNLKVMDIPVPTIAAINGHAIGAGCTLALACDMRIASTTAKLGLGFVRIGLHPGMGTTYFLPRLVGTPRAYELLLTGEPITGEEAARIGLVNRAVEPEQVMAEARELARRIVAGPPEVIRRMKESIGASHTRGLSETLDLEA